MGVYRGVHSRQHVVHIEPVVDREGDFHDKFNVDNLRMMSGFLLSQGPVLHHGQGVIP